MAWRVTADPQRFSEALAWFRERVPVTRDEYDAIVDGARRKAFTVAGVAQVDLVLDVWRAIDKAVAEGTDYREFVRDVGERLETAWGKKGASRLQTIFQTNVQSAYSAGRYAQLTDPDVLQARPFWMFDAVLDERTSGICRNLHGTVLPADDPFWDTHVPPLHFNCRSGLRSLTRAAAERRGITRAPSRDPPASGFGMRPDRSEWEPDLNRYPPQLRAAYQRKAALQASPFVSLPPNDESVSRVDLADGEPV